MLSHMPSQVVQLWHVKWPLHCVENKKQHVFIDRFCLACMFQVQLCVVCMCEASPNTSCRGEKLSHQLEPMLAKQS